MSIKKLSIILGLSVSCLVFCVLFLDPNKLTPMQFVPIVFVVYAAGSSLIGLLITLFTDAMPNGRVRFMSLVLGLSPAIIFSLMTLGRISAIDIVLAVLIPCLITWYGLRIKNF